MSAKHIVVVGAGPAGMAAAVAACRSGARVTVLDDNPAPGGQIWRGGPRAPQGCVATGNFAELAVSGATVLTGVRIFGGQPGVLQAEQDGEPLTIGYDRLILATGAREYFLPFPGWTLPGVTGAGGLQALIKGGWPVAGKRVVVAGSGPLLLAVAALLRSRGAKVAAILEQAATKDVGKFAMGLWRQPAKLVQGIALQARLLGVKQRYESWVLRAEGESQLTAVEAWIGGKVVTIPCDYLACGFGLLPSTELAVALGCELRDGAVAVDSRQTTSVPGIYCAGEGTGIGGVDKALAEGEVAGLAAAEAYIPQELVDARDGAHRFVRDLAETFALRDDLKRLPLADTIVCRCEDVTHGALKEFSGSREAKLQTRCGMGPCQGRVCAPACEFLYGWAPGSVRSPILPAPIGALATETVTPATPPTV